MKRTRRNFIRTSAVLPLAGMAVSSCAGESENGMNCYSGPVILGLNAYSFNAYLLEGKISLEELFAFAVETDFRGIDLTAYYIPGYPEVPSDKTLFEIKKMAFRYGLALSGTGVRNDFTLADPEKRKEQKQLVMDWILAASKLGVPHLRIFGGNTEPEGHTREEITAWMIDEIRDCARFGEKNGVMISYQNHNDFIKSADEVIDILKSVNSEWCGLMLDTGSLPRGDVYREIEKLIPYAVTWQVKEKVKTGGSEYDTDFKRLINMINQSGYKGWLPLETLGEGDPYEKVRAIYQEVSRELSLSAAGKSQV